jgi:hypothetical protein
MEQLHMFLTGKLHNWEGPAYIPLGDNRKREYYLNGIPFTEDQWKESKKRTRRITLV